LHSIWGLFLALYHQKKTMNKDLLSRVAARASNPKTIIDAAMGEGVTITPTPTINAVAKITDIEKVQKEIGMSLPQPLAEILLNVGNGGFGPGYGLFSTDDLIKNYREIMADEDLSMEASYLPILTWGCDIYACIDTQNPDFPVYYCQLDACGCFEDGETPEVDDETGLPMGIQLHRDTFEAFISDWADGINLEEEVLDMEDDEEDA
jgi:hypothetical protein